MKVLFLDIDGVVNSVETFTKNPKVHFPIDPMMAFMVGKIQLDTDCKVVLSSSWRYHPESVQEVKNRIVDIYDLTPTDRTMGEVRGHEIGRWLAKHPEVTRYAILDDDSDMLEEQLPNFFQTSWTKGLTEAIAKKVTKHLNKE